MAAEVWAVANQAAEEEPGVVRLECQEEIVEGEDWVEAGVLEAAVWEVEMQVEAETAMEDSGAVEAPVAGRLVF